MSVSAVIEFVKIAFSIMPLIKEGIAVLEKVMPESGQGETKLKILKAGISQAIEAKNSGLVDNLMGFVEKTASILVGTYNAVGFPQPSNDGSVSMPTSGDQ